MPGLALDDDLPPAGSRARRASTSSSELEFTKEEASFESASEMFPPAHSPLTSTRGGYEAIPGGALPPGRRRGRKDLLLVASGLVAGALLALGGRSILPARSPAEASVAVDMDACLAPYTEYGTLLVNATDPYGNVWKPFHDPERCSPPDYMRMMMESVAWDQSKPKDPRLDWLSGRTAVLFGDSIDRDHLVDTCILLNIEPDYISSDHPLAPPYPPGLETPEPGAAFEGAAEWPNFDQSRPFFCRIKKYNFTLLSAFHYGFRDADDYIRSSHHYYPPGKIEDRFDQIILPLIDTLALEDRRPDVFGVTPGFWGLLRSVVDTEDMRDALVKSGSTWDSDEVKALDPFTELPWKQVQWLETRMEQLIRHIAKTWPRREGELYAKPSILWSTLHHIKERRTVPYNRVQTVDEIGLRVVQKLRMKGEMAEQLHPRQRKQAGWPWPDFFAPVRRWHGGARVKRSTGVDEEEWRLGLFDRLKINEWGHRMLGQEKHFKDEMHPKPLPGTYLHANMLLWYLKQAIDEREQASSERSQDGR